MDPFFETIIQNSSTRILIYNGDIDTECDFMMARSFIGAVTKKTNMIVSFSIITPNLVSRIFENKIRSKFLL